MAQTDEIKVTFTQPSEKTPGDAIQPFIDRAFERGVERGKECLQRRFGEAMYAVIKGEKSANDALRDAGLPTINDFRANKKLAPVREPEREMPPKPDIYISASGGHYEMIFHAGAFRHVAVEFKKNLSAVEYNDIIDRAINAYWPDKTTAPVIAYDPWGVSDPDFALRAALKFNGAVPMKPGDAFRALGRK